MNIKAEKILAVGDIHGEWGYLNAIINKQRPEILLQTGDFGFWPRFSFTNEKIETHERKNLDVFYNAGISTNKENFAKVGIDFSQELNKIKQGDTQTKIFWVPGNHEHWWALTKLYGRYGKEPIALNDFVYYCPIGSTLQINNLIYLFLGGADSYDKNQRLIGFDWFPEELLGQADLDYVLENVKKAEVIISHTNPISFTPKHFQSSEKINDPTRRVLQIFLETYKPKFWAHSHWHNYNEGNDSDCQWVCLDYPNHLAKYYAWFDPEKGFK